MFKKVWLDDVTIAKPFLPDRVRIAKSIQIYPAEVIFICIYT
jgi:hypothetical protein